MRAVLAGENDARSFRSPGALPRLTTMRLITHNLTVLGSGAFPRSRRSRALALDSPPRALGSVYTSRWEPAPGVPPANDASRREGARRVPPLMLLAFASLDC